MDAEAVGVEGSRCAVHPERAGTACSRCGTFGCEACLRPVEEVQLCPDCRARVQAALPALGGRARLVRGFLVLAGLNGLLNALYNPPDVVDPTLSNFALAALLLPLGLAQIITPILFLRWFHLAARHALARGLPLDTTPWGAVGSWFIPFVNLVRPFALTRAMCPGAQVGPWQALYLVGNFAAGITQQFARSYALWPALVLLGAAVVGARVVKEVTTGLSAAPVA